MFNIFKEKVRAPKIASTIIMLKFDGNIYRYNKYKYVDNNFYNIKTVVTGNVGCFGITDVFT